MTAAKGMQKYELKGVVGEGAYGKVFMARNKETGEVGKLNNCAFVAKLAKDISKISKTRHIYRGCDCSF